MTPLENVRSFFQGKNVLVFGLGLLGGALGDVKFLHACGAALRVTDKKSESELTASLHELAGLPVTYTLGGHRREDIEWADIVLRNPSIPWQHELLVHARELGKPIEMRSSLFAALSGTMIIGITGTRGKTTTTMMVYELCRQLMTDKEVLLGGNIAHRSDLQLFTQITDPEKTVVVMELSSWQLQGFRAKHLSPHIAVLTNLYPDHLNVYDSLNAYYQDKRAIIEHQHAEDTAILNDLQPEFHDWATGHPGNVRWFSADRLPDGLRLELPGIHNRANAAAALMVAEILNLDLSKAVDILNHFSGVPYRLEKIAEKNNVTYINDTTATTPVAAAIALDAYPGSIFICGGSDKNLPIDDMIDKLNSQAKYIVLLSGNGTDRIKAKLDASKVVAEVSSMSEAVHKAASVAKAGDKVVLSPGFTSFGLFNNEFHRGEQFNSCVRQLP